MSSPEIAPEEYRKIDAAASLIARENFGIRRQMNKHYVLHRGEVYLVGFGFGQKTEGNPKGFYAYWVWYRDKVPYGAMVNCELKDRYDSIDYFQSCIQNAEASIDAVLGGAGAGSVESPY